MCYGVKGIHVSGFRSSENATLFLYINKGMSTELLIHRTVKQASPLLVSSVKSGKRKHIVIQRKCECWSVRPATLTRVRDVFCCV